MIQIDIDMPEKCGLCPLFHAEHPMYCQGVEADRKKKIVAPYRDPRPEWCQLHEVADTDTVSRQAVRDAVCEELDSIDHVPQWVFDRLTKKIENLPPSPSRPKEPQWIPCSDPSEFPKDKMLWVTHDNGYERYVEVLFWDMTEWSDKVSDVVAYMPYYEPEPYKEGGAV